MNWAARSHRGPSMPGMLGPPRGKSNLSAVRAETLFISTQIASPRSQATASVGFARESDLCRNTLE